MVQSHILQTQTKAQDKKDDDVSLENLERAGGYGSKLNSKFNINANSIQTRPQNRVPLRRLRPNKLVENASKMVSGQDVLDINKAISEGIANASEETKIIGVSMQQTNSVEYNNPQENYSLSKRPIVVADIEQDATIQTTIAQESETITEITPRPVNNNFLSPITVEVQTDQTQEGAQLQQTETIQSNDVINKNYQIEVQKSQPYYLGKLEYIQYPSGYSDEKMVGTEEQRNMTAERMAMENIQLGTTLLNFPVPQIEALPVKPPHIFKQEPYPYEKPEFLQLLPQKTIKHQFANDIETNDITVQQLPSTIATIHFKVPDQNQEQGQQTPLPLANPYSAVQTRPSEITKYVNTPVHVPYSVEKRIPVNVEKIIEKPIPVTKIPYTVTKYIERPLHVPLPQPQKIVKQPYPVVVPVKVPEPYPEKKLLFPQPYSIPIPQPYYIHLPIDTPKSYPIDLSRFVQKNYGLPHPQPTQPVPQLVTISQARPLYQPQLNQDQKPIDTQQIFTQYTPMPIRTYLPTPSGQPEYDQDGSSSTKSVYYDYLGLLPPRFPAFRNVRLQQPQQSQTRYRNVRSDFGKNLRLEYGFLPPMVPSLEIDEYGNPIDKKE